MTRIPTRVMSYWSGKDIKHREVMFVTRISNRMMSYLSVKDIILREVSL